MRTMNRINILVAIALVPQLLLCSCIDNDFDAPSAAPLPAGQTLTISDIIDLHNSHGGSFVIEDTAYLRAVVTCDEGSGNLYKTLYIQDATGGINLQLEESASNVRTGDSILLILNGLAVSSYNSLMQISEITPAYDIIVTKNECYIEPEEVTIKQLNNSNFAYTGKLIKLNDVQFVAADTAGTYADGYALTSKNLTLTDCDGNEVIVRNSGYANFANKKVISGNGDGIFIVSRYGTTLQLLIRDVRELNFTGERCSGLDPDFIMSQTFDSGFGSFSTYNVSGDQTWGISYSTACMTGYANSTNYANEDWLISPEIDLSGISSAFFNMEYIARYFNNLDSDITLQVSSDYTDGAAPSSATWSTIGASWTSGSDWNNFTTTSIDLSSFAGQKIRVAIKYLSTDAKAGTIEIKSISITETSDNAQQGCTAISNDDLPSQSFDNGFGSYTTYDVAGEQSWELKYSTACMTGYANSTNYDNEDWLISPEIDLSSKTTVYFSMSYIARYFDNLDSDVTLQVSTNYTGGAPGSATWSTVGTSWTSGSDWTSFATTDVDLSAFAGQKIRVAIKYTSTSTKAGTIEIKSIAFTESSADVQLSIGTFSSPLTIAEANAAGSGTKWIKGYIVGVYETKDASGNVLETYSMSTASPFYTSTNILIAATPSETDINNCMPVQLPNGDIRTALNLVDNASILGSEVMILGSIEKYFGIEYGVKSLTGYWLNGNGINPDSGSSSSSGGSGNSGSSGSNNNTIPYSILFTSSQGGWTANDVELSGLNYVWSQTTSYGMKASGYYNSTNNATESWLVSPEFDFSSLSSVTLTFSHAANYFDNNDLADFISIKISTDGSDWEDLEISDFPTGWTFVESTCTLDDYAGESSVQIAFVYTSTASVAPTWEIKSVSIK